MSIIPTTNSRCTFYPQPSPATSADHSSFHQMSVSSVSRQNHCRGQVIFTLPLGKHTGLESSHLGSQRQLPMHFLFHINAHNCCYSCCFICYCLPACLTLTHSFSLTHCTLTCACTLPACIFAGSDRVGLVHLGSALPAYLFARYLVCTHPLYTAAPMPAFKHLPATLHTHSLPASSLYHHATTSLPGLFNTLLPPFLSPSPCIHPHCTLHCTTLPRHCTHARTAAVHAGLGPHFPTHMALSARFILRTTRSEPLASELDRF